MTTIALITPPSPFLMDERVFISLGILRVAACLEQAGYTVEHLDLSGVANYEEAARDFAAQTKAVHFGLTATTPQMPATSEIVSVLRQVRPDARLILGGPHVTLVNAARKLESKHGTVNGRGGKAFDALADLFDVLVAGDGEEAVFGAISPDPPKLIDADDPASALFLTNARYEEIPFPARHLVDMDSYHYSIDGERSTSMIAQLGCPMRCTFCGGRNSAMLRRIRTRSTESVIRELEEIHRTYGYRGAMMYDDELNVNKQIVQLMDAIGDLGERLGFQWQLRGFIKSELFTDAQAKAMSRAGFRWILVGFESGSPRILENIRKNATREQNSECMAIARRNGLKVKALMSMGHAGESYDTIMDTHTWLMQEKPDDFDLTVITTYPGTPYWDEAIPGNGNYWTYTAKSGDNLHQYDVDYNHEQAFYKGIPGSYQSLVFTDHLTPEQIVSLRDWVEKDVRKRLEIPFNVGAPGVRYESSMGQLPGHMLRRSVERVTA